MSSLLKPGTPVCWPIPVCEGVVVEALTPNSHKHALEHGLPVPDNPLDAIEQELCYRVMYRGDDGEVHFRDFVSDELTEVPEEEEAAALKEQLLPHLIKHLTPEPVPKFAYQGAKGTEPPAVHAVSGKAIPKEEQA